MADRGVNSNHEDHASSLRPRCLEGGPHIWPSLPMKRVRKDIEATTDGMINNNNKSMWIRSRAENDLIQGNTLKYGGKHFTSPLSLERKEIAASVSSEDNVIMSSTSRMKEPIFNYEDAPTPSPASQCRCHLGKSNIHFFPQGKSRYHKYSSFLFHQKETSHSHQFNPLPISTQLHDLSSSGNQDIQNFSNPLERIPCSVSNAQTMKICTTFDSLENIRGGPPRFSQTTAHRFLFTQETDVNLSNGHEQLLDSTLPTQHKGLAFSKRSHRLPPYLGSHCQQGQGVKLQPLWSSSDSKEDPSNFDAECESSAETDTMVMNALQDRCVTLGVASSPLIKDSALDLNMAIAGADVAKEKTSGKILVTEIPDINEEPQGLPGKASSMRMEASSSRTQSMEVGLLSHAGGSCRSVSNPSQDPNLGLEPSSKRLNLSPFSSLGIATKSSNLKRASSHEKIMFLKGIMMHNRYGHHITLDESMEPLRNDKHSSIAGVDKSQSGMLSHSWIQRWCQRRPVTEEEDSQAVVISEPNSMKLVLDNNLEKKQFPSFAAMALMGKALKAFHLREYRKRGPVMVWTAKEY
ncbi:hypothetical protein Dimus_025533 [Dionaea muscipula]